MRGLAGASGAALVVPAGLLIAVLVAASVGGGNLGGLGQLVAGPELPSAAPKTTTVGTRTAAERPDGGVPTIPRAASGPQRSAASRTVPRFEVPRQTAPRRPPARRPAAKAPATTTRPQPTTTTPPPTVPATPPAQPVAPQPTTPAPETPVRRVEQAVDQIVRPLPVLGPPVADAVGTVVDLVDPRQRAAQAAPAVPAPQAAPTVAAALPAG